ncbi:YceO family protein [Kosakonia sp.]|nr:YceO family protein [Kosakonia sp.]
MRRLFHYVVNNVREHLMAYIVLWLLIAAIDIIYIVISLQ